MKQIVELPDYFDTLTAICKFIAVEKISPDFYQRHHHAVEMTCAFLRVLAGHYPPIEKAFRASLPLPVSQGSEALRQVFPTLDLPESKIQWLDAQTTEILKVLLPVVKDPQLPPWLSECKWAIEGAFNSPD